jgi:hypothetical protein
MKKLIVSLIVSIFATIAWAAHESSMWDPAGLPVDSTRGPWFATIDTEATEWAWSRQSDVVRKGDTAIRIELRDGDCFTAEPHAPDSGWDDCTRDRERSELRERWNAPLDKQVWYAFSVFIPEDYEPMYPKQIFFQWHGGPAPTIYYHLNENKFHIDILTEVGQTTTQYTLGRDILTLGEWHDFEVNIVWSGNEQNGKMILYVDGIKIIEYRGATMPQEVYELGKGPYAKFGIYRSHLFRWTDPRPHPTHVLYFDEYRRGLNHFDVDLDNYEGD